MLLLVYIALASVNQILAGLRDLEVKPSPDPLAQWEKRLAPLQALVGPDARLGYLSQDDPRRTIGAMSEWYATQYAMSPRLMQLGRGNWDLVLANFHDPAALQAAVADAQLSGFHLAWRDAHGLALLSKARS